MRVGARALVRLAATILPARERDAVAGDLAEEGLAPGSVRHLGAVLAVAAHYHVEAWRDADARRAGWATLAAAVALLAAVRGVGAPPEGTGELFRDPVGRAAVRLWGAPALTSSLAAGLLAGRVPGIPTHARALRAHVALAVACVAAWGTPLPWLSAGAVLAAAWLGARAGADGEPGAPLRG